MASHPEHPWIDTSRAPTYLLTYPAYDRTDAEQVAQYNREQQALYPLLEEWTRERRVAFAFVVDLSSVHSLAMNRQRAIAYLERVKKRGNPFLAGRAFVAPNTEVRGVMTAVFWQSPPDYPHAFFTDRGEALLWAEQQVREMSSGQLSRTGSGES